MAIDEILDDLISKTSETPIDKGGTTQMPLRERAGSQTHDVTPEGLILMLEKESNSRYRDSGPGCHLGGLLLAVFAAEMLSAYWRRVAQKQASIITGYPGPARMVSCLYSRYAVAFVLSHPFEAFRLILKDLTCRIRRTQARDTWKYGATIQWTWMELSRYLPLNQRSRT